MDKETYTLQPPPLLTMSQRRMIEKEQEVQTRYTLELLRRFAVCYVELRQLHTSCPTQEEAQS